MWQHERRHGQLAAAHYFDMELQLLEGVALG
jgi:hypothetical protein